MAHAARRWISGRPAHFFPISTIALADILKREANSISTAYTPHPCTTVGQHRCEGDGCGGTYSSDRYGGTCDPDGCDFNSYRQGVKDFYGPGMTVDTTKKFTVVTQFLKGSDGQLSEIKRFYVQNGKTIPNSQSTIDGVSGNSITPEFCKNQKVAFGDSDTFNDKGGFAQFSKGLSQPMVLVMSLWDDHYANMLWLDSTYPTDASPDEPGKGRGTCDTGSGVPTDIETSQASNQVIYCKLIHFSVSSADTARLTGAQPTSSSAPSTRPSRTLKTIIEPQPMFLTCRVSRTDLNDWSHAVKVSVTEGF